MFVTRNSGDSLISSRRRSHGLRRSCAACVTALLILAASGCSRKPEARAGIHRFVVFGIDGADPDIVEARWKLGELPNLKRLADEGTFGALRTDYGVSPIIWTSIATGVTKPRHGITGFVVPTDQGDVPISSGLRKVPAIWNMLSTADRTVDVIGWWASWPAETVNGVIISDRLLQHRDETVYPPDRAAWASRVTEETLHSPGPALHNAPTLRFDRVKTALAQRLLRDAPDLLMVYVRSVDAVSHESWKYFQPEKYPKIPAEELARHARDVPDAYAWADRELGRLRAAAGPDVNFVVLSDHGFYGRREFTRVRLDFDSVLQALDDQRSNADGTVDVQHSSLFTFDSPDYKLRKLVRCTANSVTSTEPDESSACAARRRELAQDLQRFKFDNGDSAFEVVDAKPAERSHGADFVVRVIGSHVTMSLLFDGKPLPGVVKSVSRISGSHGAHTLGMFAAAGPDIQPGVSIRGLSIFDITPTLLYGMGLPVAKDFDGRPMRSLYRPEFRQRVPLKTIPSWGSRTPTGPKATEQDEDIKNELRALGYL